MRIFILFVSLILISASMLSAPAEAVVSDGNNTIAVTKLKFKFFKPSGKPCANASIHYNPGTPMCDISTRTDVNGVGEVSCVDTLISGEWFFVCCGIGYAHLNAGVDYRQAGNEPIPVHLQNGSFISGKVISYKTGVKLGGVRLYPTRECGQKDEWQAWNFMFKVVGPNTINAPDDPMAVTSHDGDGTFSAGPLPPGQYKMLLEDNESGYSDEIFVNTASPKANHLVIEVPLYKKICHEFSGRMLRKNMTPITNKELYIWVRFYHPDNILPEYSYCDEPFLRRVKTNAKGEFKLYPIYPDAYVFNILCDGMSVEKRVTVPQKTKQVDFIIGQ